jgi:hypothetical protein
MVPACWTEGEGFVIPTFDLAPSDVDGFLEALWEVESAFHDCLARREPRSFLCLYRGMADMAPDLWRDL